MGQNYHLVHHLWPSIPWFEYKPAYEATKPLLNSKGSPQRKNGNFVASDNHGLGLTINEKKIGKPLFTI